MFSTPLNIACVFRRLIENKNPTGLLRLSSKKATTSPLARWFNYAWCCCCPPPLPILIVSQLIIDNVQAIRHSLASRPNRSANNNVLLLYRLDSNVDGSNSLAPATCLNHSFDLLIYPPSLNPVHLLFVQ